MGRFAGKVLFATGGASGIGAATARRFAAEGGRVAVVGPRPRPCSRGRVRARGLARDRLRRRRRTVGGRSRRSGARAARPDRRRLELRRVRQVHAARGALARGVEPPARGPPDGHVPRLQGRAAGAARVGRRLDRQRGVGRGAARAAAPRGVRGREGRHHLVLAPARARRGGGRRARERARAGKRHDADDSRASTAKTRCPHSIQGRFGEPEEIAAAACFLLSDDASFFTAAMLVADGGATAL